MNYLTNYYKNLSEELSKKLNLAESLLNEISHPPNPNAKYCECCGQLLPSGRNSYPGYGKEPGITFDKRKPKKPVIIYPRDEDGNTYGEPIIIPEPKYPDPPKIMGS